MSSELVSRRAVARGAAWTVPLVAIGVAAPAFAASPGGPPATVNPDSSCKCPGGNQPFMYHLDVNFTTPTTDTWTITLTNVTLDADPNTATPVLYAGNFTSGSGTITFKFSTTNSKSGYAVTISYTATDVTTNETFTVTNLNLGTVKFNPCGSGVVCP
jgi:hypothetical protein